VLLIGVGTAIFTLYLCQVRSIVVILVLATTTVMAVVAMQGRVGRSLWTAIILVGVAVGAFALAVAVGGEGVTDRLQTLVADDPTQVYQSNRGRFLEYTIHELVPEFPLGAGLGRWGMVNQYFADRTNRESTVIWSELAWTSWILDGGIPLAVANAAAILAALAFALRTALRREAGQLTAIAPWAAVLVGYDVGALAMTFDGNPFAGTWGVDFWMLNGALCAAASAKMDSVHSRRIPNGRRGA
jgi:hypothetical protein